MNITVGSGFFFVLFLVFWSMAIEMEQLFPLCHFIKSLENCITRSSTTERKSWQRVCCGLLNNTFVSVIEMLSFMSQ